MEGCRLIIPCVAIVFLVLAVLPPPMVSAGKAKSPRMTLTPRSQQQMRKFFKNNSSDDVGGEGQQGGGADQPGKPGDGSNGGGQGQAPATNAGMYLYSYQVGTPPQTVSGALDISSSLLWTTQCGSSSGSTTMVKVPCSSDVCQNFVAQNCSADDAAPETETETEPRCGYLSTYRGGEANTTGYLATESFTFVDTRSDGLVFGCSQDSVGDFGGASGVIGLGRGPLSMLSQLDVGSFSYYFAHDDSDSNGDIHSFILFGDDAAPQTKQVSTTPLLASDDVYPDRYLVGLTGIRVDGKDLGIPSGTFDLNDDGSGGVLLSISVPVTYLEESAYRLLREALVTRIGLPTVNGSEFDLDLCYESQSLATAKIPAVALVFDGDDAVMDLEVGNYFYMDASSGLECLTILPTPDDGGRVSLLGSLIQAGTHMIYDINGSTLSFESLLQTSSSSSPLPPASSNNSSPGTPGGHRLSSAPPPHISLPMLFAHFLCLWVAVYLVF